MIEREKILQWFEIEHDLYEENGYIFVVEIDLFNNQFVDGTNEAPYISVDVDFYPEHFIERLNTNNKE